MTKEQAIQSFFESLGLPAYEENSIPSQEDLRPEFPYITYSLVTDSFDTNVLLNFSMWYRDTSWADANAQKKIASEKITRGGVCVNFDGGAIWIRRGSPFAQEMGDMSDNLIKRIYFNLTAEFISAD